MRFRSVPISKAFTLVTLMIVLALIFVIAIFVIPNLMETEEGSSIQSLAPNINRIMAAVGIPYRMNDRSGYIFGELNTGFKSKFTFCAAPDDDDRSGEKEYCVNERGTVFEANFDSSAIKGTRNTVNWTSLSGRPTQFVVDPENYTTIWTPIWQ